MVLKYKAPQTASFQMNSLVDIALTAHHFKSHISLRKGRTIVDPKSFIEMVGLIHAKGGRLEISAEGEDAYEAVKTLRQFVSANPRLALQGA